MNVTYLDRLVLTVKDIQSSIGFYYQTPGMKEIDFLDGRKAVKFGAQKINLH